MSIVLMHAVALALAATVTVWIAPIAVWTKSDRPRDASTASPSRIPRTSPATALQVQPHRLK